MCFSIKVYASAKDTQLACSANIGVYPDKTKTVIQDVRKITRGKRQCIKLKETFKRFTKAGEF